MLTKPLSYNFPYNFFLLRLESDDDDESSDKIVGGGSGPDLTFDSCFSHFDVEIGSDRVFSVQVGISSIVSSSSIFIFCSSSRVVVSRVNISLSSIFSRSIFSRSIYSRSNALNVSESISLTYCLNSNVSLIFLRSS